MNEVRLHGELEKHFGGPYQLDVGTPREAVKALVLQVPGFQEALSEGAYALVREVNGVRMDLDLEMLQLGMRDGTLHIYPEMVGAGEGSGKGIGKILIGVLIIGAVLVTGGTGAMAIAAGTFGGMLAASGVAMLLSPSPPATDPNDNEDKKNSVLFNGAVNVQEQGHPLALTYGRYRVGSIVGSADMLVEQMLGTGQTYDWQTDNIFGTPGGGAPVYAFPSWPAAGRALQNTRNPVSV